MILFPFFCCVLKVKMRLRGKGASEDVKLSWWKLPEKEKEQTSQTDKVCLFNNSYIPFQLVWSLILTALYYFHSVNLYNDSFKGNFIVNTLNEFQERWSTSLFKPPICDILCIKLIYGRGGGQNKKTRATNSLLLIHFYFNATLFSVIWSLNGRCHIGLRLLSHLLGVNF